MSTPYTLLSFSSVKGNVCKEAAMQKLRTLDLAREPDPQCIRMSQARLPYQEALKSLWLNNAGFFLAHLTI